MSKGKGYHTVYVTWLVKEDGVRRTRLRFNRDDKVGAWENYRALCAVPTAFFVQLVAPDGATTLASWDRTTSKTYERGKEEVA